MKKCEWIDWWAWPFCEGIRYLNAWHYPCRKVESGQFFKLTVNFATLCVLLSHVKWNHTLNFLVGFLQKSLNLFSEVPNIFQMRQPQLKIWGSSVLKLVCDLQLGWSQVKHEVHGQWISYMENCLRSARLLDWPQFLIWGQVKYDVQRQFFEVVLVPGQVKDNFWGWL